MRILLCILISFQFIIEPAAAQLGEAKPFSAKDHLIKTISKTDAEQFETELRKALKETSTSGVKSLISNENSELVKTLTTKDIAKPVFKETNKGKWEYKTSGTTVSFTALDIYQGQMVVNGKVLKFKDVPLTELEKNAEKLINSKTSFLNKLIGIEDAYACELICAAVVVVLVVAIVGTAVYQLMVKPEKMVKRLKEMKAKLDQDANACNEAKSDQGKYEKTFSLANSVADRGALSSASSSSEALEYALKKQLESGSRKNEDCFQIMNEIGKKVKIDIPIPTERQKTMRELGGGNLANEEVDVANAAFNLCHSYNQLGSCMENFVAAHVNDSDINTFKEQATPSHWRYQKKAGANAQ